jgi:uncharacterized protein GlcG (DUF336 family)
MRKLALLLCVLAAPAFAQDGTFTVKHLTPETALKAAQATLAACRAEGAQIAVAVVDRSGVAQVLLRDRFAGPHTVRIAIDKAWTSVSFRQNTLDLVQATQTPDMAGARQFPRFVAVGGGVLIEGGGSIFGAIGVSGAPGGAMDDKCAKAGLAAIADELNF